MSMKSAATIRSAETGSRSRIAFYATTSVAIAIVVIGWLATVATAIGRQVQSASSVVSDTTLQAREQFLRTRDEAQPVTQRLGQAKDELVNSVEMIQEIPTTQSAILERIKMQIEADYPLTTNE